MKRSRVLWIAPAIFAILFATLFTSGTLTSAAPIDDVTLGVAGTYSLLAGSAMTKGDASFISGISSTAGIYPTLIAPDVAALFVTTGASSFENGTAPAGLAQSDLATAISAVQGLTPTVETPLLSNQVLMPGVYAAPAGTALAVTVGLVLDGGNNPDARFIFRTDSALNIDPAIVVSLINGTQARNVFWMVGSAVTIGAASEVPGNFLVVSAATIGANDVIRGSLLCQGAVTIGANSSIIYDTLSPPIPTPTPTPTPTPSSSPPSPLATPIPSATPSLAPSPFPTPLPVPIPKPTPVVVVPPSPAPIQSPPRITPPVLANSSIPSMEFTPSSTSSNAQSGRFHISLQNLVLGDLIKVTIMSVNHG